MSNRNGIILCGLGGGLFGILCVGGLFWIFSMLISSGYFSPEGIHYMKNSNGDVVYIDGQQCTIDTTAKTSVRNLKALTEHCIEHHQKFLNKQ
jgi:hypothetical protein